MEYSIIIHSGAKEDIKNIFRYIYKNTQNFNIATNVYNKIYSAINSLDFLPEICQIYFKDFRVKYILNYRIFYKINEAKKEVHIYYIIGTSQNFYKIVK